MAAKVTGVRELNARLKAMAQSWKPIARKWTQETKKAGRTMVPVRTGRLRKSFRQGKILARRATVVGHYTGYFVDAGPKPHTITARRAKGLVFQGSGGRTIFARQVHHRGYRARPFRKRMAREGLERTPMAAQIIDQWNRAA